MQSFKNFYNKVRSMNPFMAGALILIYLLLLATSVDVLATKFHLGLAVQTLIIIPGGWMMRPVVLAAFPFIRKSSR